MEKRAAPKNEIAIMGAGVIGSALAMALGELGVKNVVVYDPDLEGTLSSSELNAGGVRATFMQELNVLCSKLSIDYFAKHAAEVGYRPVGYLWIHRPEGMAKLERAGKNGESLVDLWARLGWPVERWDLSRLQSYAPFIDRTEDLAGAAFGPRDGLLNPNLLKLHFRARARERGVRFVDRHLLRAAEPAADGISLSFEILSAQPTREAKEAAYASLEDAHGELAAPIATGTERIVTDRVVNCAGPWAKDVARILGYACPSHLIRRQISLFDSREIDLSPYGMIVDPSGVYFHPEAGYILGGVAERDEKPGQNFNYGGEDFFQERIWMPLSERSSKFEALRHLNGWAGLYEVSPDESAIIGQVHGLQRTEFSERVFESHSYSGHGVMHSYACGVALAELLVSKRAELLDLAPFNGDRFRRGRPLHETAVI